MVMTCALLLFHVAYPMWITCVNSTAAYRDRAETADLWSPFRPSGAFTRQHYGRVCRLQDGTVSSLLHVKGFEK
jgi:hypothetical protein